MSQAVRLIAIYLPQFHPTPENDEWWGKGFTEWRNVTKARPLFSGHYQPHLPADLGFYDLRLPEIREAQAELARQHGIHGFCYYHYWFNGRRILERPFNEVLESGKPDFPFCLCWANENWSRAWDGGSQNLLLEQNYSESDDREHILSLIPALNDARYVRINGRPLLLIYRTELLPDPKATARLWRDIARKEGVGEIYLARVENFVSGINPESIGFDAAVEFSPNKRQVGKRLFSGSITSRLSKWGVLPKAFSQHSVFQYSSSVSEKINLPPSNYKQFRCVTPMWDNTARLKNGRILIGSTPQKYEQWLATIIKQTQERLKGDERIIFINAWNEWAEGCHLEPDLQHGHAYLEATKQALDESRIDSSDISSSSHKAEVQQIYQAPSWRQTYWRFLGLVRYIKLICKAAFRLPIN